MLFNYNLSETACFILRYVLLGVKNLWSFKKKNNRIFFQLVMRSQGPSWSGTCSKLTSRLTSKLRALPASASGMCDYTQLKHPLWEEYAELHNVKFRVLSQHAYSNSTVLRLMFTPELKHCPVPVWNSISLRGPKFHPQSSASEPTVRLFPSPFIFPLS